MNIFNEILNMADAFKVHMDDADMMMIVIVCPVSLWC